MEYSSVRSHKMKQLKSTYQDLRRLFERQIKIKHIAENLQCCTYEKESAELRQEMEDLDFDVMGIENDGKVEGYVERLDLRTGPVKNYKKRFLPSELMEESAPLLTAFYALHYTPRIFVTRKSEVIGIITRGDLQKAPIRMWLFGLITLLEMHLLRIIRNHFKADYWTIHLSDSRIVSAKRLFAMRKARNEAIDLADCLQFCDKRELIFKVPEIKESMKKQWGKSAESLLESAEELRDKLAHAQDIVTGSTWPNIIDLVQNIECLLKFFENCE
jgi:predicted transcriptional regulator